MEKEDIIALFIKYRQGRCSEEERALLEAWYLEYNDRDAVEMSPRRVEAIGRQVFRELPGNHGSWLRWGLRLTAAAGLIGVLVAMAVYFWAPDVRQVRVADVAPGGNKAVLTLADGRRIVLDSVKDGALVAGVTKLDGALVYGEIGGVGNNIIAVPRGGTWQVTLPDGSKVWLNSASELVYPASFKGMEERVVELKGEGYFEVARDTAHPFLVKTDKQVVSVLGTRFNVSAYAEEGLVRTVLAEGKVRVSGGGAERVLLPGQESLLNGDELSVGQADIEEALAWKEGYFRFNDESIESIMRKLSRWYDIEVIYNNTPAGGLNGRVARSRHISQVLRALEATRMVHFKVEGRRVTVLK